MTEGAALRRIGWRLPQDDGGRMKTIEQLEDCPRPASGTVVSVGNFDGVHKGHQAVIASMLQRAQGLDPAAATAVVTFEPHTMEVLQPNSAPERLTAPERKLELLALAGLDLVLVVDFDAQRVAQSAESFVQEILVDCLNAKLVMVGTNFRFGHKAQGDVALLESLGKEAGFAVEPVTMIEGPEGIFSSTAVREAVRTGDMTRAAQLLGRPHDVRGEVVAGHGRGKDLGFPTANIAYADNACVPPEGVYASRARLDGVWLPAVTSVGTRPQFDPGATELVIEPHLLDFSGDIYGKIIDVGFVQRLRGQQTFATVDDLVAQMNVDKESARQVLRSQ